MKLRGLFGVLFIVLIIFGVYIYIGYVLPFALPPQPTSTVLLDRNHEEIGEIPFSGSVRHRPLRYDEIPEFSLRALVTLEDRSFWTNNGVDLWGILRSTVHNVRAGKVVEGASTLSSGLVRNALWIREDRGFKRKMLEFLFAIRMNHMMTKEAILTEYVNRISFGYMNVGLGSASIYYFGKEARNLTEAEQLALLVLPKDPKRFDPFVNPVEFRARYEVLLDALTQAGVLSERKEHELSTEKLLWRTDHESRAPYVRDFLKGKNIALLPHETTTFDIALTEKIAREANSALDTLLWRNVTDYGVLIAERGSPPKLRVMIGGYAYHDEKSGQVNTTLALRQPGSTIKPFTYLLAFERLGLTPDTPILDLPTGYKTFEGYSYEPKNYSQEYLGDITLRRALAESVNIPAVKLLEEIGVKTLLDFLQSLGISSLRESEDHYGLALTLGDGEVSLFELLQAYTIFSEGGKFCPLVFLETETREDSCTQKVDPKYVNMVTSILSDRYAKIGGFPINSALDFADRFVVVKTGTSRNFRDNWAIGFTEHYLIGVWVGNKSGENMKGVSGVTGAGEIFRRIVYVLEPNETSVTAQKRPTEGQPYLSITKPIHGSIYAVRGATESITPSFRTNMPYDIVLWTLDGKSLTGQTIPLTLGSHTLKLILMNQGVKAEEATVTFEGVSEER